MYKKIKRFLICFLAVTMMASTGNIYAEGDNDEASETAVADSETGDEESEDEELVEEQEEIEIGADDVKRLMTLIGESDGVEIYARSEEYEDEIWAAHGGNPKDKEDYDKDAEPTQDQLDAEADIELLDNCGELAAIDKSTGEVIATFEKGKSCDEGETYLSGAERYIVVLNEDLNEVIKFRHVISTLDDPLLFATMDNQTLELMDDDFKNVEMVYNYDSDSDGKSIYYTDDKSQMAWLSEDKSQVLATVRYVAENDDYKMLVDDRTAIIGIENKSTGYIWWSSPIGSTRDSVATPLLIQELRSSNVMTYGIPASRTTKIIRSNEDKCSVKVSDCTDGVKVTYDYSTLGIKYPVEYTLEDDHLKASLKVAEVEESGTENIITQLTLLGSFGAGAPDEDGYFVVPDGSGALINFNNGKKTSNVYSQRIYGSDKTAVPNNAPAVTEQVYLPCYGIVKEDNAMLVVASKGDSNATINASVSGQSKSSYNLCNFSFTLRGTDTFYMSGNTKTELTVFESGGIKSDDIEVLYYPISKDNASYVDIAEKYRNYLTENKGVAVSTKENSSPLYIDLYGGVEKEVPVMGIPVTQKTSITSYSQAEEILRNLSDSGVDEMVVSYNNWTNAGICDEIDYKAKPSGTLGGKGDFEDLTNFMSQKNIEFYPTVNNMSFYSGNGYYSFSDTAVRVSGAYSRIISYDRAYGVQNDFKETMSLLSPNAFKEVYSNVAENYSDAGLKGVSLGDMTSALYGDYGKLGISRFKTMTILEESYSTLNSSLSNKILADSANAYALPYVSHITEVPLSSSRYDVFDEDIPFYQLVLHGVIPYSTTAVNGSADSETLLLMAIATGSNLYFDMLYEETSVLKDTDFDVYYYANYEHWLNTATAEYKLASEIIKGVSNCTITDYVVSDDNVITTTYSNGTVIKVDLENKTIDNNGQVYKLDEYAEEGGIKF